MSKTAHRKRDSFALKKQRPDSVRRSSIVSSLEVLQTENSWLRNKKSLLKKKLIKLKRKSSAEQKRAMKPLNRLRKDSKTKAHENSIPKQKTSTPKKKANSKLENELKKREDFIVEILYKAAPQPFDFFISLNHLKIPFDQIFPEKDIDLSSIPNALGKFGEIVEDIPKALNIMPNVIPRYILEKLYQKYSYKEPLLNFVKIEDVQEILKHISLKMQLHRIPKNQLSVQLLGPDFNETITIGKKDLSSIFQNKPLKIKNPRDLDNLSNFLLESNYIVRDSLPIHKIMEKLMENLENWHIFTPEEEEKWDREVYKIVSKHREAILTFCQTEDKESTGFVPTERFFNGLEEISISLNSSIESYLRLLFYSYNYDFYRVPYQYFLKSYSQSLEEYDVLEEEKASVIRKYLDIIAKAMIAFSKSVRKTFKETNGFITPQDFINGIHTVGVNSLEENVIAMILEALQYADSESPCIAIDELEELFEYYGVRKDCTNLSDSEHESIFSRNEDSVDRPDHSKNQILRSF